MLQSIVCHTGIINAGHYYTFYNDVKPGTENAVKLSLFELNDDVVDELENPCQQLDSISGKHDVQES